VGLLFGFGALLGRARRAASVPRRIEVRIEKTMSLVQPQSQVDTDNAARHHCGFWSAG
jgi:hypothetical protein